MTGEILVAKEAGSTRTMPIDLQWMVMTCDPESVERETCEELPVRIHAYRVSHLLLDWVGFHSAQFYMAGEDPSKMLEPNFADGSLCFTTAISKMQNKRSDEGRIR